MRNQQTFHRVIALVPAILCLLPAAEGRSEEPVLLATWEVGMIVGSQEIYDARWPALAYMESGRIRSPLFEEFTLTGPFPVAIQNTVSAGVDPEFEEFVAALTNGRNEGIRVLQWGSSGVGAGGGGEDELFALSFRVPRKGADLVGYTVDHIRQILIVDIESPGEDPHGDGLWTDWSAFGCYEFYGMPIPEPGSAGLLAAGCALLLTRRQTSRRGGRTSWLRRACDSAWTAHGPFLVILAAGLLLTASPATATAQCQASDSRTVYGLGGGYANDHEFLNRCLAASGTNVTITIEAMADLGCNSWDATHDPPPNQCSTCGSIPCCDTAPESKYLRARLNGQWLVPSIPGSTNIPPDGYFFQVWHNDCTGSTVYCAEAGRSPCDGTSPISNNRQVVTIPAATWNTWLGSSGNTMTVTVTSTAAMSPSLADYCYDLGFWNGCGAGACSGPCGPDTLSKVSISYTAQPECTPAGCQAQFGSPGTCREWQCQSGSCVAAITPGANCGSGPTECSNQDTCSSSAVCLPNHKTSGTPCTADTNPCTNDYCNGSGACTHPNNSAPCDDGAFCNGVDTCAAGACQHPGNPCDPFEVCDETIDLCRQDCNQNGIPDALDVMDKNGDGAVDFHGFADFQACFDGSVPD